MENSIKVLIESCNDNERNDILDIVEILMKQRISLVRNDLHNMLGLQNAQMVDKENITRCVKLLNEFAKRKAVEEFHVNEDWNSIELFLRNTIMDDLAKEFKAQAAN